MIYIIAFGVSFAYIALKACQQIAVVGGKYVVVVPVAFGLALCEVTVISMVVRDSLWIALPIGAGGALGAVFAMIINRVPRHRKGYTR